MLYVALCASLILHTCGYGAWRVALRWALSRSAIAELRAASEEARRRADAEVPTVFVEVTPEQTSSEPPETTPFYSTANSRASNPNPPAEDTGKPRIEGKEPDLMRTVDVLRPSPEALQPSPPSEPETPAPAEVPPPKREPGDLAVAPERPPAATPPATRSRPRTLVEARLQQGLLAGPKARQEGGVRRPGVVALDAKASPFGAYDAAVIAAIQKRWYDLLEDSAVAPRPGRVVVEFTMHYDGRVTDLEVTDQQVGEILALYCRKAISDPAPFNRWPAEMRQMIGRDYREVRITFHYL